MNSPITLEEVMAFPKQVSIETVELPEFMYLFLIVGCIGLIISMALSLKRGMTNDLFLFALCSWALVAVFGACYLTTFEATEKGVIIYEAGYKEWKSEYVNPYIATLPVEKSTSVEKVSYDYILEAEEAKEGESSQKGLQPLKITDAGQYPFSVWAEVIYNEEIDAPYYLYKELEIPLDFNEIRSNESLPDNLEAKPIIESGKRDVVLYTNDPNFKKYSTTSD